MKNKMIANLVFPLFLLAQVDWSYGYSKLGCTVFSNGFDLYQASESPTWASSQPSSLHIEQNNWESFLTDLTDLISDLDYKGKYENILDYVSFYKYYKHNKHHSKTNESFSDIFESYESKISWRSNEYRKTIDILEQFSYRITEYYDDDKLIQQSLYLGSGLLAPPEDLLKYIKTQKPKEDPIVNYYLHVPGIIKFTLGDTMRPGFILIGAKKDAKNGPIVVMKDEEEPDSKFSQYGEVQIDFQIWKDNEDYIISQRKDDKNNTIDIILNVAKPYCSVVDTSFKYNLLAPIKGLVEKDENEKYQGFYVDLSVTDPLVTLLKSDGQKKEIELSKFKTKEEDIGDDYLSTNNEEEEREENELEDNGLEGNEVSRKTKEEGENEPEGEEDDKDNDFYGRRNGNKDKENDDDLGDNDDDDDNDEDEDEDDDDESFDEYFYTRTIKILRNQKILPALEDEKEKFIQEINDKMDSDEIIDDFLNVRDKKETSYGIDEIVKLKQIHLKVLLSELANTAFNKEFLSDIQDFAKTKIPLVRESLNIDKVGKHFDHFMSAIERRDKYFFSTLN